MASGIPSSRPAQHRDRAGVVVVEGEVALRRVGAIPEQQHRVGAEGSLSSPSGTLSEGTATIRSPESANPSRLVASTDTLRAATRDQVDLARHRVEEMLTVVEHEEQSLLGQKLEHRFVERPSRERLHAKAAREGLPDHRRAGNRRELAQPRPVGEVADDLGGGLHARAASCRRHRHR